MAISADEEAEHQLSGEAQELFSVRHRPVRAARILPAPHIMYHMPHLTRPERTHAYVRPRMSPELQNICV
ncbi:hypothetical protein OJAV_G00126180 [Oryzias javanicus]|uniref:BCAS3 WD40 domain-containing protein n=1 Tax=Oryzias javanicus TaxID=123683 RepID=A0A3S2P4X8_ORYJA|nr:hypothetical protein OJAV_G00126180 [Oryzias javanicus]